MRYEPPVVKEETYGNVTLRLLGGDVPVFSAPRTVLPSIDDYERVEVVILLNGAHRVTPNDLDIEGFGQWDEYAQFPSGAFISWEDVNRLREELRKRESTGSKEY